MYVLLIKIERCINMHVKIYFNYFGIMHAIEQGDHFNYGIYY